MSKIQKISDVVLVRGPPVLSWFLNLTRSIITISPTLKLDKVGVVLSKKKPLAPACIIFSRPVVHGTRNIHVTWVFYGIFIYIPGDSSMGISIQGL